MIAFDLTGGVVAEHEQAQLPVAGGHRSDLPCVETKRKSGTERFLLGGDSTGPALLEFWQWGSSDLLKNTERAILAEYLVALDLGVASGVRAGWLPFDLTTVDGITVEVKASSYVQSWFQRDFTKPLFDIKPKRAWHPCTDTFEDESRRQAQVYVFCLLHHREQETINPMDLSQWTFWVLPTSALDERAGSRASVTLAQLAHWGAVEAPFGGVRAAIEVLGLSRQADIPPAP